MAKYDPNFWEISVDPRILESALTEPDFLAQLLTAEDEAAADEKSAARGEALAQIRQLIAVQLTPQQRRIVELYFFENKTQQEISAELGINQQVVSKHLFGALRDGEKVGGALKKLRKLCARLGIDPKRWV